MTAVTSTHTFCSLQAKGHWEIIPHAHAGMPRPLWAWSKQDTQTWEIRFLYLAHRCSQRIPLMRRQLGGFVLLRAQSFCSPEDQTFWLHKEPKYWVNTQMKVNERRKPVSALMLFILSHQSAHELVCARNAGLFQTENNHFTKTVFISVTLLIKAIFSLEKLRRSILFVQ